ncbi:hypothetical protein [Shewanella livingstonensis]
MSAILLADEYVFCSAKGLCC